MRATSPRGDVTEIGDDNLDQVMTDLESRGFEPVLIAFRSPSGEVEVLTRKIDLRDFVAWLHLSWLPFSIDRKDEPGH